MQFLNPDPPLTEADIAGCEAACRLRFPAPMRACYLGSNGGKPDPYVFENDEVDTVVARFLPLVSGSRGTAVQSYQRLVSQQAIVPPQFFPFAVDGGGDYFFADTNSPEAMVSFFRADADEDERLLPLNLGIDEFWAFLKPE